MVVKWRKTPFGTFLVPNSVSSMCIGHKYPTITPWYRIFFKTFAMQVKKFSACMVPENSNVPTSHLTQSTPAYNVSPRSILTGYYIPIWTTAPLTFHAQNSVLRISNFLHATCSSTTPYFFYLTAVAARVEEYKLWSCSLMQSLTTVCYFMSPRLEHLPRHSCP